MLLAALALLMAGVTARALMAMDARLGPTPVAALRPPAAPLLAPVEAPVSAPREMPLPTVETVGQADPPATPVPAAAPAPPSPALASSAGSPERLGECAATMTSAVNADPTAGEISGATGLPDQVTYFKPRGKSPSCPSLASTIASPR